MTRFLNVPLDVTDVFIMTFMILQDSYMEPTRVGSDIKLDLVISEKKIMLYWGHAILAYAVRGDSYS